MSSIFLYANNYIGYKETFFILPPQNLKSFNAFKIFILSSVIAEYK